MYDKTIWYDSSKITADKLNKIEEKLFELDTLIEELRNKEVSINIDESAVVAHDQNGSAHSVQINSIKEEFNDKLAEMKSDYENQISSLKSTVSKLQKQIKESDK